MSFVSLSTSQVQAKAPVDEALMQQIKANEDDLNSRLLLTKAFPVAFKFNGELGLLPTSKWRRFDGALMSIATTFLDSKLYLERPGFSGTLEVDARKVTRPNTQVTAIARLFNSAINSIARTGSSLSTQSITRSSAQINTQSITAFKATINVSSIVLLGSNLVRYNLASLPDSDWVVGDSVTFSGCSTGANNLTAVIVRIGDDGGNNIVISNASGVAQSGSAGSALLLAFSYNFTNPVSSQFAVGEQVKFNAHTSGVNDGSFAVYARNSGGNNLIVKNSAGATQGGAAGTADTNRWIYAQTGSVSTTDYIVGEKAHMNGHTNVANDGDFPITNVNSGGNNVIVYNSAGVVQGGTTGTVNTNRWTYFFSSDPAGGISAGDSVVIAGTTSGGNSGTFVVGQVDRSTSDNVVIYNVSGVAQGGAGGTLQSLKTKVSFSSDQSAVYSTDSFVELYDSPQAGMDDQSLQVLQVNRGGGSNFNVVVSCAGAVEAAGNAGRIIFESRSLFSTRPSLTLPTNVTNSTNRHGQVATNGVFNAYATVLSGDMIAVDITRLPLGHPANIVLQLQ